MLRLRRRPNTWGRDRGQGQKLEVEAEDEAKIKEAEQLWYVLLNYVSNYIKTKTLVEERSVMNISTHVSTSVTIPKHIPKAKETRFNN